MELYVSNLSYDVDEAALEGAFAPFGQVRKVSVVKDKETGQSRGFGFVDMPDEDEASRAIRELSGVELMGRALKISEARPRGSLPPPRPQQGGAPYGAAAPYGSSAPRSAGPGAYGGSSAPRSTGGGGAPYGGTAPRPMGGPSYGGAPRPAPGGFRPAPGGARPSAPSGRDFAPPERGEDGAERPGADDERDESARKLQRAKSLEKKKIGGGKQSKQFEDGSLGKAAKRISKKGKTPLPLEELDEDEELLDQFNLL